MFPLRAALFLDSYRDPDWHFFWKVYYSDLSPWLILGATLRAGVWPGG